MASKDSRSKSTAKQIPVQAASAGVALHAVPAEVAVKTAPAVAAVVATPVAVVSPAAAVVTPVAVKAAPVVVAEKAATAVAVKVAEVARDRSSVVALIGKLRDLDADIARDAATTLATLPADAEAVDALCAVLRNADGFCHSVVRAAAAAALGKIGDRRAVEALIAGTRDAMAEASEEAVIALGLLGDVRAVPTLQGIVSNERGFYLENVRKVAAAALARLGAK